MNDNVLTLDRMRVGANARVCDIGMTGERGLELLEMGMTPGTEVAVSHIAPLGDPMDILVRGYHLSLRRSEARFVTVIRDGDDSAAR